MKGFATLLLLLIVFAAGLYAGGSLGVTGKPNDVYLQTDYTYGVIPYFNQGDRIHFFDPNKALVKGQYAAVDDVSIVSKNKPCQDLDTNGICTINVPSGTYKYQCFYCGDPTIPVGTNGPINGSWGGGDNGGQSLNHPATSLPGSAAAAFFTLNVRNPVAHTSALATVYPYNSLYARIARAFVATFFTPKITPGQPVEPHHPLIPPINSGTIQAFIDCDPSTHKITVEGLDLWYPATKMPLLQKTKLSWARQIGLATPAAGKPPFIVQDLPGSTDFASICGGPLSANNNGVTTPACTIAGPAVSHTVKYTITDPTGVCTAAQDFSLDVAPATPAVSSEAGTGLPGIR